MNLLKQLDLNRIKAKYLFFVLSFIGLVVMMSVSNDYGITNDEPIHQIHGEVLLKYFKGTSQKAAMSPIDSTGNLVKTFVAADDDMIHGMNFFGGFFDLCVNYLYQYFPSVGMFEFRHRINAIFGFLMMLFVGLIAQRLANWRAAILAFSFAFLYPMLFGHSFNNPKDIPFAAFYVISIYFIIRVLQNLPKISWVYSLFLALSIGISISIRVSGVLLIFYLFLGLFLEWFLPFTKSILRKESLLKGVKYLGIGIIIGLAGYATTMIFWPYARTSFLAPINILLKMSNFSIFNSYELFDGKWYNAWEIPKTYIPVWIFITIPPFVLFGFSSSFLLFSRHTFENFNKRIGVLLLVAIVFPLVLIIYKNSNIYNGIRHLMFVFPLMIIISALVFQRLFELLRKSSFYFLFLIIFIFSITEPALFMIKNHPYEAMYFSPFEGGAKGVFKKFELDYWGFSTKDAVDWIAKNTTERSERNPVNIKMNYGDALKVSYYTGRYKNLNYASKSASVTNCYEIIYPAQGKFDSKLLLNWPPKGTVHEIMCDGAPMCAIVKEDSGSIKNEDLTQRLKENLSEDECINLSLEFYQKGDYINCIWACNKALGINPNNAFAYNNMGSALNIMKMFDAAAMNLKKALEIDSKFIQASNNLAVAVQAIKADNLSTADLLSASYYAYSLGDYKRCIQYSEKILIMESKNQYALNNIGSAYNVMGDYKNGAKYCKKALEIDPKFELAKNNLAFANSKLSKK